MISSIAYLHVRKLGEAGEPEWRTVFWFSLVSTLGGLPWVLMSHPFHEVTLSGALLLLGVGGFGAAAQLCMTRAYKQGKTLAVASFAYTTVVFSSLLGYGLWGEHLAPLAWSGVALIVGSGVMAIAFSQSAPSMRDSAIVVADRLGALAVKARR